MTFALFTDFDLSNVHPSLQSRNVLFAYLNYPGLLTCMAGASERLYYQQAWSGG